MKNRKEIRDDIERNIIMNKTYSNANIFLLVEILIELKFNNQFEKEDK